MLTKYGTWDSLDSSFRSLTKEEITDLKKWAESVVPEFGTPGNAQWEEHHPLAREIWERRGFKPNHK